MKSNYLTIITLALLIMSSMDAIAQANDSIRIVPNFNVGDSRTYLVTTVNEMKDLYTEVTSVEYRFTVESVDENHYGIYFIAQNMKFEMPKGIPESETRRVLDFFCDKGFTFFFNRHELSVDSVCGSELKEPLRDYFSKFFTEMLSHEMDSSEIALQIEKELTDEVLNETARQLMQKMVSSLTDQYGRTLPIDEAQWTEIDDEDTIDEPMVIDTVAVDLSTVEDRELNQDETTGDETWESDGEDDEVDDDWENHDHDYGPLDFAIHRNHRTTTILNDDGSIEYSETITYDVPSADEPLGWQEQQQAKFDPQGWYERYRECINDSSLEYSRQVIEQWEQAEPESPDVFAAWFNYYYKMSRDEVMQMTPIPPEDGRQALEFEDSTGAPVYMYEVQVFDDSLLAIAHEKIDKAISLYPDRLDLPFGKLAH